jgi:hypothetical protein
LTNNKKIHAREKGKKQCPPIPILEPSQLALDHHECALSQGHSTPLPFPSGPAIKCNCICKAATVPVLFKSSRLNENRNHPPAHRILLGCFAHSEKDKQLVDIPPVQNKTHDPSK